MWCSLLPRIPVSTLKCPQILLFERTSQITKKNPFDKIYEQEEEHVVILIETLAEMYMKLERRQDNGKLLKISRQIMKFCIHRYPVSINIMIDGKPTACIVNKPMNGVVGHCFYY